MAGIRRGQAMEALDDNATMMHHLETVTRRTSLLLDLARNAAEVKVVHLSNDGCT